MFQTRGDALPSGADRVSEGERHRAEKRVSLAKKKGKKKLGGRERGDSISSNKKENRDMETGGIQFLGRVAKTETREGVSMAKSPTQREGKRWSGGKVKCITLPVGAGRLRKG